MLGTAFLPGHLASCRVLPVECARRNLAGNKGELTSFFVVWFCCCPSNGALPWQQSFPGFSACSSPSNPGISLIAPLELPGIGRWWPHFGFSSEVWVPILWSPLPDFLFPRTSSSSLFCPKLYKYLIFSTIIHNYVS